MREMSLQFTLAISSGCTKSSASYSKAVKLRMVLHLVCVQVLLSHLTTGKPLTKLVTGGGFFSTDVCPCSVARASPPVCCVSFFLLSSSIFFLNISMKLPSLANTLPPGTGALLPASAGLLDGDAGLESPLLPSPGVWGLPCARFGSMSPGRIVHTQAQSGR